MARLVSFRAVGGFTRENRARWGDAWCCLRVNGAWYIGDPRYRRVLARRRDALGRLVFEEVGEAHHLHGIEVVEVAPIFLEAMCCGQCGGVVAKVILAELAGAIAEIEQ